MFLRMLRSIAIALVLAGAPLDGGAQPPRVPRIGVLVVGPRPEEHACVQALRKGFADIGYVEGRTHVLDMRWADGPAEVVLPRVGADLVAAGVDVIVSVTAQGLVDAKQALAAVPVVMAASSYPVERGLVASLGRPGGNITGMSTFTGEMFAKRIQLLVETLPGISRVAVLRLPGDQNDLVVRDLEMAARGLGLKLDVITVRTPDDISRGFVTAVRGKAQALMTAQGPFFHQHSRSIAELALKHRLPTFSGEPKAADAGILLTHGASIPASCHRAAGFVDRILKGAKPADLPVEQTTTSELEINLKTARALGVTIPRAILLRADRVID